MEHKVEYQEEILTGERAHKGCGVVSELCRSHSIHLNYINSSFYIVPSLLITALWFHSHKINADYNLNVCNMHKCVHLQCVVFGLPETLLLT